MRASLEELTRLPEAFPIVDENDVLRDEGEAYARRLTEAGVRTTSVRAISLSNPTDVTATIFDALDALSPAHISV